MSGRNELVSERSIGTPVFVRVLLMALAGLCVAIGTLGIFVPGLPTTVFILVAGWSASRSSPRFASWLDNHRLFGPMLCNWRAGGYVSRRTKWITAVAMAVSAVILFASAAPVWLAKGVTLVMILTLIWLWNRPEPPV